VPVVFAFHGYPWLIHRLTYRRHNHDNIHVRGYKEEGTTTTPFDMCVLNNIDRFQLALDAITRVPRLAPQADAGRAMVLRGHPAPQTCMWPKTATTCPKSRTGAGRKES
jgi:phosphoketolase